MEIEKITNVKILHYESGLLNVTAGNQKWILKQKATVIAFRKPNVRIAGWKSRFFAKSKYAVLFLDYDDVDFEFVKKDALRLQEKYSLGTIFIVQTKSNGRNFHVYCFDVLEWIWVKAITEDSNCDKKFKNGWLGNHFKSYILRLEDKGDNEGLVIINVLPKESKNELSIKHFEIFFAYFRPQFENDKNLRLQQNAELLYSKNQYVTHNKLRLKYNTYRRIDK